MSIIALVRFSTRRLYRSTDRRGAYSAPEESPAAMLGVTPEVLRWAWGLSPAEAAVVIELVNGATTTKEIARRRGTAPATVRTQLLSISRKSGLAYQNAMVVHAILAAGEKPCPS